MRLFRTIAGAQDGRVFTHMGDAFGINDELAAQVVRYFLPPLHKAILKRMETQSGLIMLLELIGSRRHDRYLADPGLFYRPTVEAEATALMTTLIPNRLYIRKIIENRTKVLPLPPETLEAMLPYITIMLFGALELRTRQPLKDILLKVMDGRADPVAAGNPYRSLAESIRQRQEHPSGDEEKRSALTSVIGALFRKSDERRAA